MELIFATNNQNKVQEIQSVLPGNILVKSLKAAGIEIDIPEPHDSLQANATEKSMTIYNLAGKNCFSEDTGLEVDALNGAPGVKSARYAEGEPQYSGIIDKLLKQLGDNQNRRAHFRTVISLILDGKEYQFEGTCEGRIAYVSKGTNGFGYDAVFIPDGADRTFGEMTMAEKKIYSHRRKATDHLVSFLLQREINNVNK